ncbi:MAG: hypothetical protein ACR2OJ_09135 [Hyphomicrobiales bacterium]
MPLVLLVMGGLSILLGVVAIIMRFIDGVGLDFSLAFGYQAIVGGVLLIAFSKLLKHVADTDANTARLAQAQMMGGGVQMPTAGVHQESAPQVMGGTAAASSEPTAAPMTTSLVEESPAPAATPMLTTTEPVAPEPEPQVMAPVASNEPIEQIEVRGYMVDVFANGTVDVHTAEGAMRFESLAAFERELDRAAG